MFDKTSAELISEHRKLNTLSGSKARRATVADKQRKLAIKDELRRRAGADDKDCYDYLHRSDEPPTALVEPAKPQPRLDGGELVTPEPTLMAAE